jgi:hypothetical protein
MYAYYNKSERAQYEHRRRKAVIGEAREHRVMSRWLQKVHPKVYQQFTMYYTKLQTENPNRKDLSTAPQFVRHMYTENGT